MMVYGTAALHHFGDAILKTHQKPASFDFSTLEGPVPEANAPAVEVVVPASFSGIPETEPVSEPIVEPEPIADPEPATELASEPEKKKEEDYFIYEYEDEEKMPSRRRGLLISLIVVLCLIVVVVVGFIVLKNYFPDLLDRMLYTKEELEILNYYR